MPVTERELHCDILVAGGGPAGVPCALAAARRGARVILCQDRPVLGGNASSEIRMHVVGANGIGSSERGEELVTEAREGGIIEEIRLDNAVRNPQRSASVFDLVLYDKCRAEPRLDLMLNTAVTGAEREGGRIVCALAERPSTEERFRIRAETFIDCSGDGRLGAEAGAAFREGRESAEEYGETLAPESADSCRLGSTLLLQAEKHDRPMPFAAPGWVRKFSEEDLRLRLYATPGDEESALEYGFWWAEWGGTRDTIRDNEAIRDELLAIALGIWDHIKNGPGRERFRSERWALEWIGFIPGKRESRRFLGRRILTERDILEAVPFPDAIATGGWPLDIHPPEGVDAPEREPCVQHPVPWLYDIPLRACVARDIPNLMFAGRNLSATHVAFASTRVMATCAAVGQGVGTAAAVGIREGIEPAALPDSPSAMRTVQRALLEDDCFLIGKEAVAEDDPVGRAIVTASSEQGRGSAENVRSPQTRATHGARGTAPGRSPAGTHRWMSDPTEGFPCWLRFDWDEPVELGGIRLVLDTGLHRHLTLSHHDGYSATMEWGRPQPETLRDFDIETERDGAWTTAFEIRDNYQRLVRRRWEEPVRIRALRIVALKSNGLDHARICGVFLEPES